jgi:acetyl esterase/lipase
VRDEVFGEGAQRAWLLHPDGEPRAVLLFLHGSGEVSPAPMAAWLGHLRRIGAAVVYPQYQSHADAPGSTLLDDLTVGVRLALEALGRPELPLGSIGFSRGAHLAVHQAARAADDGLPVARAILGVFPGRLHGDQTADLTRLPREVDVTFLIGDRDQVVGRWLADHLVSELSHHPPEHVRIVEVDSHQDFVADHEAPMRDEPGSHQAFWRRSESLLERISRTV